MNNNFISRFHSLIEEAYTAVTEILKNKGTLTLFTQDDIDQNENMKIDLYDNVPDFPFFDRHDYIEYAAIQEIKLDGEQVYITGIYKGNNFPDKITISLDELEGYYAIALAEYLHNDFEG